MSAGSPRTARRPQPNQVASPANKRVPRTAVTAVTDADVPVPPDSSESFVSEQDLTLPDEQLKLLARRKGTDAPQDHNSNTRITSVYMNGADVTFQDTRLGHADHVRLVAYALAFPRFAEEMLTRVPEDELIFGTGLNAVLRCARYVLRKGVSGRDPDFLPLVKAAIAEEIEDGFQDPVAENSPHSIEAESKDIDGVFALLEDAESLNEEVAFDLLKRYLVQVKVLPVVGARAEIRGKYPDAVLELVAEAHRTASSICAMGPVEARSVADEWAKYEEQLETYRGRQIIGLRTGTQELDRRTLGLRGFILVAAPPNIGKSVFACTEIALGVCQHHAENDCAVVIVSLEMFKDELKDRLVCNLANVTWRDLKYGQLGEEAKVRFAQAKEDLSGSGIGRRLFIYDRCDLGDEFGASRLEMLLERCKRKSKSSRGLLIVDYLQVIPVPDDVANRGDIHADKYRVRLVQQIIQGTKSPENPKGDTVLAISEARKPSSAKEAWGQSLSELMGTARLGYAGDAVLFLKPLPWQEIRKHYGLPPETNAAAAQKAAEEFREKMLTAGYNPLMIRLDKGRDGMERGEWPVEFDFRRSKIREIPKGVVPSNWPGFRAPPASELITGLAGLDDGCHKEVESVLAQYPDPEIVDVPSGKKGAKKTAKKASAAK